MPIGIVIAVAVVLIVVAAVISHFLTVSNLKNNAESKIGNAEARAREIIDDAVKTAEAKKKESLLEIKEESIKNKNELEKETKERRSELQRYEKRVLSKEEALDKKSEAIERREAGFTAKEEELRQREAKVEELSQQRVQELERISGLTSEQAKEYLLKTVEEDVKHDTAKMIKELEAQAKEEADKVQQEIVVLEIERSETRIEQYNTEIVKDFTSMFLEDIPLLWSNLDLPKRQAFLQKVFEGSIICGKDKKIRTDSLSPSFKLIAALATNNGKNVTRLGLEPRTPRLKGECSTIELSGHKTNTRGVFYSK